MRSTRLGAIDILINCAGVQNFGFFAEETAADTATLFNVNTIAPIALTNAVLPHMLKKGKGQIVNVGSIFGSIGFPCFASYSASKFALRGFSEALRRELTGTGVGVTYVAPRFTRTAFNRSVVARMANALKMNQDEPESVAASVIASHRAQMVASVTSAGPRSFSSASIRSFRALSIRALIKQVDLMRPFATETTPLTPFTGEPPCSANHRHPCSVRRLNAASHGSPAHSGRSAIADIGHRWARVSYQTPEPKRRPPSVR